MSSSRPDSPAATTATKTLLDTWQAVRDDSKRIVIKLGTQIVVDAALMAAPQMVLPPYYLLAVDRLRSLVAQVQGLRQQGREVLLVSSGAVGLGRSVLGWLGRSLTLAEKQACAAIGQPLLMSVWRDLFSPLGIPTAQVLLTSEDFSNRTRYLNLEKTLTTLLANGVVPVLNENDTVHTAELQEDATTKSFGDNDRLSALVAAKLQADLLVILTQSPGLFTDNPELNPDAQPIPLVRSWSDLEAVTCQGGSTLGRGGMGSKLEAVRIASIAGVDTLMLSGLAPNALMQAFQTDTPPQGTLFLGHHETRLSQKKQWIGFASGTQGIITLNPCAVEAILKRASLLPVGIVGVEGRFPVGAIVSIQTDQGEEIGRGKTRLSSEHLTRVQGLSTEQIATQHPSTASVVEAIHRDDLVVFKDVLS